MSGFKGDTMKIPLSQGRYAIINVIDYPSVQMYHWHLVRRSNNEYAERSVKIGGKKTTISMHRTILTAKEGEVVDHINGIGIDNRRLNMRICGYLANSWNAVGERNTSSKFKGVNFNKNQKEWYARIGVNGDRKWLGSFPTEKEAAIAYNEAAKKYHGEYAKLNEV